MVKQIQLTPTQEIIHRLSELMVQAQKPIRVLDAIKWTQDIQKDFFKHKCKKLPKVDEQYYQKNPLPYDPDKKIEEFYDIEREIHKSLGQFSGIGNIMLRMCREYRETTRMLQTRGTMEFSKISQELYGSTEDAFYAGAPSLANLGDMLSKTLMNIQGSLDSDVDVKRYTSEEAVKILKQRLGTYFHHPKDQVTVKIDDGIVADAAAGAEVIKLRRGAMFSERDLKILEVHEGWVHVGTTKNGLSQPICTFLSKGPPSSTIFQEGLAIILEIFTFVSHPQRIRRLTNRINAIRMAEQGGNFIEVFNYFREEAANDVEAYIHATRIFRGSTPTLGPFTKDLAYNKGFILIYNYIRLAIREGLVSRIPLMFLGKTSIEDLHIYDDLVKDGTIVPPKYLPIHFRDLAGLTCWMSYSLFLNQLNLERLHTDYKTIL